MVYEVDSMTEFKKIPDNLSRRLDIVIENAWEIFINQFLNKKYEVELEAPFQLHFASILKLIGELYCLKRREIFFVDLESKVETGRKNKYIDIICGFIRENEECKIPIELKFKTLEQSAEDLGAMEIYKDIYDLENLVEHYNSFQSAYFLMITDNHRYVNPPRKKNSLREEFNTSNGYKIQPGHEYKYTKTKTGEKFYKKNGAFTFKRDISFNWINYKEPNHKGFYFLKVKI